MERDKHGGACSQSRQVEAARKAGTRIKRMQCDGAGFHFRCDIMGNQT